MKTHPASFLVRCVAVVAIAVATVVPSSSKNASAAERQTKAKAAFGEYQPGDASIDLFDGMQDGQLEVKFIPKDSTQANVLIKNKTDKPLNVKLPKAFAAVPVLAQMGGGLGGGGRAGGGNMMGGGGGMNQGMGGGMGGGGMGMGGGGMGMGGGGMGGGGMFNVPPEKVGKLKVPCVCLEHGKAEPRAAVPYRLIRIDEFTKNPAVHEVCALLGNGKVNQRVAQAAAWNLNNNMGWDTLSAKQIEHVTGATEPYFSADELRSAMSLATEATTLADARAKETPTDKSLSTGRAENDALPAPTESPRDKSTSRKTSRTR